MIEQALYEHLQNQVVLDPYMAKYLGRNAIFNQEAPPDTDEGWETPSQYARIVFAVDLQGDPERTVGGTLLVDITCQESETVPEDFEPIIRGAIHGWFFSNGIFTVAAQWKNSSYFTEPTKKVTGCTMTFDLLGFPVLTSFPVDVIERINEWCAAFDHLHVINHDELPCAAWKPDETESAVYWRLVTDDPAKWIPDTYQTIWRKAILKCHIFSQDIATAYAVAKEIRYKLYAAKRLLRDGESPIMVNQNNTVDIGADPLRTGQLTVEATYGEIVVFAPDQAIERISYTDKGEEERRTLNGEQTQGIR